MGRNRHGSSRRNRCEVVSTALRSIVPPAAGWQTRTRMFRPGYAMLEVLVAMMAVAIMLGALLSALNHANTQLQSARNQARALALAEERVERFRAQFKSLGYLPMPSTGLVATITADTYSTIAGFQCVYQLQQLSVQLPPGSGTVYLLDLEVFPRGAAVPPEGVRLRTLLCTEGP